MPTRERSGSVKPTTTKSCRLTHFDFCQSYERCPTRYGAALSEYSSLWPTGGGWESVDDRELDAIRVDFADRPLIVLTRGNPQPTPGVDPAHAASADSAWVRGGTALARASTRGTPIVIPKSDHHIQFDQPMAVIDAVRHIVAEVRRP